MAKQKKKKKPNNSPPKVKYELSNEIYRKIKQSNRQQLETFMKQLYNNGIKTGLEAAEHKRNIPFNAQQLSIILLDDIKGISVDKAAEIIKVLTEKYELQQADE
ncbi:MAG: hypothetical protein J1E81_07475 [Eubacterium sp.]|nr:hypothetical protein [Eubacterium sp.]